ncbi:MAG: pyridoxal phosphate-dependent aminotransferase [Lachnospiraceae bacterium]|nr:pyridoxal phosphate-dependent aminotransferase [Lachnospiraceae bacterium]
MMKYARVAENIPASPIRDMMVRVSRMEEVISFAVGEPDFDPPDSVIEAAKTALDQRDTRYAPGAGITELRGIYAEYLTETTGVHYETENVIVTAGGMASLFLGLLCMVDPGDEVLVSAPYFSNYSQMIAMCHGTTVPVEVYEKDDFVMTPESLREAITPKTKALILNSPCNPTGGVISQEALSEIAKLALEYDLNIISDEVYSHILFDGEEYHSIASLEGMAQRTLIVDSCSKTFAMTGFRVGFGAGPEHLIALMTKLTEGVYSAGVTFSQRGAIEAFRSGLDHCSEMCREYEKRRDYIYTGINRILGLSCIRPKGAFYIFVNISGTGLTAIEFSDRLLEEEHVAVVPGDHFGARDGSKYIRISYAVSMDDIIEGVRRIAEFCRNIADDGR